MDVETFYDGYLVTIMVEEGVVASVGSAIALLAKTESEIAKAKQNAILLHCLLQHHLRFEPQPEKIAENVVSASVTQTMKSPPVAVASTHLASEEGKTIVASPYAKNLAKELKVDLGRGRIVAKDVEAALSNAVEAAATVTVSAATGGARQQLRGLSWGRWFLQPQCWLR